MFRQTNVLNRCVVHTFRWWISNREKNGPNNNNQIKIVYSEKYTHEEKCLRMRVVVRACVRVFSLVQFHIVQKNNKIEKKRMALRSSSSSSNSSPKSVKNCNSNNSTWVTIKQIFETECTSLLYPIIENNNNPIWREKEREKQTLTHTQLYGKRRNNSFIHVALKKKYYFWKSFLRLTFHLNFNEQKQQ